MNNLDLWHLILPSLKAGPVTSEQLWMEHATQWHQLGWSLAQLKLWLACIPALQPCDLPNGDSAWMISTAKGRATPCLADELVALLQKAERPVPLAQLISKLPAGMVVTEPMLCSAAQQDTRLELKGPLLKLA